ncbi:divergent polysaccharide deacetylase family protein [Yoonia sp.]|uniref:divergent polysaccharide deacetylase family protein n=1 Tax=Yoonia sp. TaxID=2212373 RepID=UPI0019EE0734|nr:divergent polysaccharide deacetylase family protein [Yoonia sp.]MBE0413287.1 divergent polysaccharide deacetylase family protein [Yoonia sp.]
MTQEDDVDSPALIRFAAAFENPAGWPLIGVVLLDDGTFDAPAAMLAELSLPLTVILDPAMPDARSRMQAYRAAGAETGLQTVLPQGARAQDVEITLEAALSTLPEALVLFSGADDAMQNDRIIYDQMITALADKGVGLITITRGLNPVARNATEAGVPTAMVLRDLAGMDDAAMRRSLDQAALRARQGVDVVISAPLTADVLVMLAQWSNSARVAVAPASAILSGD